MARLVFSDMPKGLLSAGLTDTDTTVAVQAGQGERFPAIVAPEVSWGYLFDGAGHYEKVKVTAHTGGADAFTVERGQGGTTARAWVAGNAFDLRLTVEGLAMLAQTADLQSGAATWATGVAGTADAIVLTFDPPIAAYSEGMALRFQAAAANTGAVTVAVDGLPAKPLRRWDGIDLAPGDLPAGTPVGMVYVAGEFRASLAMLPRDGSWAMTGPLTLSGDATSGLHALAKQQLDAAVAALNTSLATEATTRANADSSEAATRAAGDNSLLTVMGWKVDRASHYGVQAVGTLTIAVITTTAFSTGDLISSTDAALETILPEGTYLIMGRIRVDAALDRYLVLLERTV